MFKDFSITSEGKIEDEHGNELTSEDLMELHRQHGGKAEEKIEETAVYLKNEKGNFVPVKKVARIIKLS